MKRLIKAFTGNVGKSDVEFKYSGNYIEMYLTNEDKKVTNDDWHGQYAQGDSNTIGFISYEVHEFATQAEIFVPTLELREEYRGAKALLALLDEFKRQIIDPLTQKYDKDKITISANFANRDLAETIETFCRKRGFQFMDHNASRLDFDFNSPTEEASEHNFSEENISAMIEALEENGMQPLTLNGVKSDVVKNKYIDTYARVVGQFFPNKNTIPCCIDNDMNIYMSILEDGPVGCPLYFDYVLNSQVVDFSYASIEDMLRFFPDGEELVTRFSFAFGTDSIYKIEDIPQNVTFDELDKLLSQNNESKTANSRLKRRLNKES